MIRIIVLFLCLVIQSQTWAHHGYGGRYDRELIVELEGELVRKLWRNPHIRLSIKDDNGDIWQVEGGTASAVTRSGISSDLVKVGDRLRLAGFPSTSNLKEMIVRNILLPSGKEIVFDKDRVGTRWQTTNLIVGAAPAQISTGDRSAPELGIFRTWSTVTRDPDSKGIFPEAAKAELVWRYPLTPQAAERLKNFDPATDNPLNDYCAGKGMPMIMDQPWGMEFADHGDRIIVRMFEFDSLRTIYMDPSTSAPQQSSKFGFSTGHWDGDTLVVQTSHVNWPYFSQMGVVQSEDIRFTERFSLVDDGSRLNYQLVAIDPSVFTEPVTLKKYWIWNKDVTVGDYDCVE